MKTTDFIAGAALLALTLAAAPANATLLDHYREQGTIQAAYRGPVTFGSEPFLSPGRYSVLWQSDATITGGMLELVVKRSYDWFDGAGHTVCCGEDYLLSASTITFPDGTGFTRPYRLLVDTPTFVRDARGWVATFEVSPTTRYQIGPDLFEVDTYPSVGVHADFTLSPDSVGKSYLFEVNPLGVPEPAAWALMILGFGLAGAVLRRQGAVVRAVPSRI